MGGNIPVFRAGDIQAYTPPAPTKKAEDTPATTTQVSTAGDEKFAELGDLKQYDTDGNGKITKDEFNANRGGELLRAKAEKEKELFKKLDANGDGKLSSDEFLKALANLGSDSTVAKVRDHVDGEFNQRKASDGTIHVDPKVQAGGGDTKTDKAKEADKKDEKKETKDYTVKGGDTLNKIAKAHGVTLSELKEANPELFKGGKDSHGKTRTAGGDLIYPGDKIKLPTKTEKKAGGGDDKGAPALNDKDAVKYLQDNFDKIAGPDGKVSRAEIASNLPEGPGKAALLKHFDSMIFAKIDDGQEAWSNLTKADVEAIGKKLGEAGSLDKVADGLTQQVVKDRGIKDQTGDGKVDAADLAAFVKANGGGAAIDKQQAQVLENVNRHIAQLKEEKAKLTKDLDNPAKKDEARARIQLLEMQTAALENIKRNVGAYKPDSKIGAEDANKVSDILGRIDQIGRNLGNPQQMQTAKSQLTAAYSLLQNPKLYDPSAPSGTLDAVINKQAVAVQHGTEMVTKIVNEMDKTIADLANPARQKEAQARLEQMRANIELISKYSGQISDFRRSANLTPDQATKAADLLTQIDAQLGNLTDPTKTAKAQTDLQALINQLNAIK